MPSPSSHRQFEPPTGEQLADHLDAHALRPPSRLVTWLPIFALGLVLVVSLTQQNVYTVMLPWLTLGAVVGYSYWRMRHMRTLEHQVTYAQELSMLRHHEQTLRLTWQLLPQVATAAMLHNRVVAYLAYSLDQLKVFDAAIVAYDNLIGQLPPQHPGSVQLQIQRAIAQLQLEQLIDADDTLRRMRHMADTIKHTAVGASYRLAGLLQQVRTHHFAEAIEESGGLLEDLRPLGVEAAYGQALMALCYHQHGGAEGAGGGGAQNSRLWWSRATLLMPPATLVDRFDELGTMVVKP